MTSTDRPIVQTRWIGGPPAPPQPEPRRNTKCATGRRLGPRSVQMLTWLTQHGIPATVSQAAAAIGIPAQRAREVLEVLRRIGLIDHQPGTTTTRVTYSAFPEQETRDD